MSPALTEIVSLSEQLRALAALQAWDGMLTVARERQHRLEVYFDQNPAPDAVDLIRSALTAIQQADQVVSAQAGTYRQQLLQDAVDMRQRWQMSSTYQNVQNLQT